MSTPDRINVPDLLRFAGGRRDVRDFGAKLDARVLTDVEVVAGSEVVHAPSHRFATDDIGKRIAVLGAGPVLDHANDGVWLSTITAVSGGDAVLATPATTSGSFDSTFGTPDDDALRAAMLDAATTGGIVWLPAGDMVVTEPLTIADYVSWAGESRELSTVHILQDDNGSKDANRSTWLNTWHEDPTHRTVGVHLHDFTVEARAHIRSSGYFAGIKPLNIYRVERCWIERVAVLNSPATAIPFDHSYDDCAIVNNLVVNPGRLAPDHVGNGGSGIGMGTAGVGRTDPTVVRDNHVYGRHSATASPSGHNGIFVEAQSFPRPGADADRGTYGYRIVNNLVERMPFGISECGANGTLIEGNVIRGCGQGIRLSATKLDRTYPGRDSIIRGNVIVGSAGPDDDDGIGIEITTRTRAGTFENVTPSVRALVDGNKIIGCVGWGVRIQAGRTEMHSVAIRGNSIHDCGRSGILVASDPGSRLAHVTISANQVSGNGRLRVEGDTAGILVAPRTRWEGGRIQDNDLYDPETPPTQTVAISASESTLAGVRIQGNTGDG